MTYEEMIQIEEARVVAEKQAWERLHQAIFKELSTKPISKVLAQKLALETHTQQFAHRVSSQNDLLGKSFKTVTYNLSNRWALPPNTA